MSIIPAMDGDMEEEGRARMHEPRQRVCRQM